MTAMKEVIKTLPEGISANWVYSCIDKIWHFPLFTIGGNALFVGNFVLALLMLWIGIKYYKSLVSKIQKYIINYGQYDKSTAHVVQRIVSYFIVFVYISAVLDIANIPINAFAFLGGAVALSIGLGAQTLIGNFLSGLIVMMERSLKIGDLIEIEGVVGIVQSVGIRSTEIKTFCNSSVIIPNSDFVHKVFVKLKEYRGTLECKAILSIENNKIADEVLKQDLNEILSSLKVILPKPVPEIYLSEVGNKTSKYTIYFYPQHTAISKMEHVKDLINNSLTKKWKNTDFDLVYPEELKIKTWH